MGDPTPVQDEARFGRYLRNVREQCRLSLDAVEELTHRYPGRLTKSHLSRIENGWAEPTFPRLFTLCQVYGVPIASMAEHFEADLRRAMVDGDVTDRPSTALLVEADALRMAGKYRDALLRIELLIDRDDPALDQVRLRLQRVSCLAWLSRHALAREECEDLLGSPGLAVGDRVATLQYLAQCCHRLGRFPMATMVLEQALRLVDELPPDDPKRAHLPMAAGSVHYSSGRYEEALADYRTALVRFEQLGLQFDASLARLNCGSTLIDCGKAQEATRQLNKALRQARARGFDRIVSSALHALGRLAFRQGNAAVAESRCLQSNRLARVGDYATILFCNTYYLWRMARDREDQAGVGMYERTLRRYLTRVPGHLPEAREFVRLQAEVLHDALSANHRRIGPKSHRGGRGPDQRTPRAPVVATGEENIEIHVKPAHGKSG